MTGEIGYYFWMNSDWAYLGADRLENISRTHRRRIRYMPIDLPEIYKRTGGQLLGNRSAERRAYRIIELKRWCKLLGMHVNAIPKYMCPNADLASLLVIAADRLGLPVVPLYKSILHAEWCEDRDISDVEELKRILSDTGLDVEAILAEAGKSETKAKYRQFTEMAIEAGVFGSPSYVYNGELFWGQDRLDMLDQAVALSISCA